MSSSLMKDFLRTTGGTAVIDGGLATELERKGADLNDPLWSAKCLLSSPHLIREVHLDYLENGADIIITASYQATIQGFKAKGLSDKESEDLIRRSVEIAREARDVYYERCAACSSGIDADGRIFKKRPILIAGSVGSYGAYLADGSEYSGDYGDYSRPSRLSYNVITCQDKGKEKSTAGDISTIYYYSLTKQAYSELLKEEDISIPAWFCFNSKDGINVVSGDSLEECISIAESCSKVVAVGINCTPPRFIHDLIVYVKQVTTKPIVIYPNSGETYDGIQKKWVKNTGVTDEDFVTYVNNWIESGASLVGGCCRTTPATIKGIYTTLSVSRSVNLAEDSEASDQKILQENVR
ncbi:selenocysteine methyltransferase-like [Arachis ipaensis]|uniref:selenocysteine methyltransferase-like n=1 Tax=Arachis ipaensis TaxID=130454 RepID=UPI000A2B53B2|nr:selenocysteine methyltransferase-like [Arachis ipaensis]